MKKRNPDWIFECRKCQHEVYVTKAEVHKMLDSECPECGEEAGRLWLFVGEGDFENR